MCEWWPKRTLNVRRGDCTYSVSCWKLVGNFGKGNMFPEGILTEETGFLAHDVAPKS